VWLLRLLTAYQLCYYCSYVVSAAAWQRALGRELQAPRSANTLLGATYLRLPKCELSDITRYCHHHYVQYVNYTTTRATRIRWRKSQRNLRPRRQVSSRKEVGVPPIPTSCGALKPVSRCVPRYRIVPTLGCSLPATLLLKL
jgi:hypothetical protein